MRRGLVAFGLLVTLSVGDVDGTSARSLRRLIEPVHFRRFVAGRHLENWICDRFLLHDQFSFAVSRAEHSLVRSPPAVPTRDVLFIAVKTLASVVSTKPAEGVAMDDRLPFEFPSKAEVIAPAAVEGAAPCVGREVV